MKKVRQILEENKVEFKEKGADYISRCLNPEHIDTHPSLHIDILSGKYNCFSCGFKGSVYRLFNEEEPVFTTDTTELLAKINKLLVETEGLEIPDSAETFSINYRNIKADTFKQFEAFTHSDYPSRLVFPIKNALTGKITNFVARTLFSNVSPRYLVYPGDSQVPIYPLLKSDVVIIVEGLFDLINCHDKGLTNVTCAFGTKLLEHNTREKLDPFVILGAKKFVLLFDNDGAGSAAAKSLAHKMNSLGLLTYIGNHLLPSGKDPGDLDKSEVDALKENITCLISQ